MLADGTVILSVQYAMHYIFKRQKILMQHTVNRRHCIKICRRSFL